MVKLLFPFVDPHKVLWGMVVCLLMCACALHLLPIGLVSPRCDGLSRLMPPFDVAACSCSCTK